MEWLPSWWCNNCIGIELCAQPGTNNITQMRSKITTNSENQLFHGLLSCFSHFVINILCNKKINWKIEKKDKAMTSTGWLFFGLFSSKIGIWSVGFGKRGKSESIKKEQVKRYNRNKKLSYMYMLQKVQEFSQGPNGWRRALLSVTTIHVSISI